MRVSGLDKNGDWRFGKGRAVYKRNSDAIAQNVVTRLRSFTDDWFLDMSHGLPWLELLGSRNNQRRIRRAIERTVLQTEGVLRIDRLDIVSINSDRRATIDLVYTDVLNNSVTERVELPA